MIVPLSLLNTVPFGMSLSMPIFVFLSPPPVNLYVGGPAVLRSPAHCVQTVVKSGQNAGVLFKVKTIAKRSSAYSFRTGKTRHAVVKTGHLRVTDNDFGLALLMGADKKITLDNFIGTKSIHM